MPSELKWATMPIIAGPASTPAKPMVVATVTASCTGMPSCRLNEEISTGETLAHPRPHNP